MKLSLVLLSAVIVLGLAAGALALNGQHKHAENTKITTVQGELIDTACYVSSDGDAKGPAHAECARKCLASGIPAAILPEGSKDANAIVFLLTNPVPLAPHAAKTIKVEGVAHPNMKAIDVKKLYVKEGENWKEVQLQDEHHKAGGGHEGHEGH